MQGGVCQPSDSQIQGVGQNAFNQMIDNALMGDAQAKQRAEGHIMTKSAAQQENMTIMMN